jgi:hypothetical protein
MSKESTRTGSPVGDFWSVVELLYVVLTAREHVARALAAPPPTA